MIPLPRPTFRALILRAGLLRALALAKAPWHARAGKARRGAERILSRIDKSV